MNNKLLTLAREYWQIRDSGELGETRTAAHNALMTKMQQCDIEYTDREHAAEIARQWLVEPGQFVKIFAYNGYVQDVYYSKSGKVVLDVIFAKDVARSNPPELWRVDQVDIIESSNVQNFYNEIESIYKAQGKVLKQVLDSATVDS